MAKVMIADESPSVRYLISVLVEQAGHQVVMEAGHGLDILEWYDQIRPDLLIVDLHMPIVGGVPLIRAIVNDRPEAKLLVCTGMTEELPRLAQFDRNIPVVKKPFDNDSFVESLSSALRQ